MTSWSRLPKQSEMSPSMKPVSLSRAARSHRERFWQPRPGRKPWEWSGELDVVVRVKKHAHHLGDQLVRPGRQT